MTVVATAVLDLSLGPTSRFLITVSGLSGVSGASTITVRRTNPTVSFTDSAVRGFDNIPIPGDSVSSVDYEFPLSSDNDFSQFEWEYEIMDAVGGVITTGPIEGVDIHGAPLDTSLVRSAILSAYPGASALIRSVSNPDFSVAVALTSDFDTWTVPSRILGNFPILGRPNPIVLRDVTGGYTGEFQVLSYAANESSVVSDPDSLKQVLDLADTLLFTPFYDVFGPKDIYFAVSGDVTATRTGSAGGDKYVDSAYVITVPFTQVDKPLTDEEQNLAGSWNDVFLHYPTWQDVFDNNDTWLDVLNDPSGA